MMFYLKNENNLYIRIGPEYSHVFNEIDCAFIFKGNNEKKIQKEIITCYKQFEFVEDYSKFYSKDNFQEIKICPDDVVLIETKSSWKKLNDGEVDPKKKKFSQLIKELEF